MPSTTPAIVLRSIAANVRAHRRNLGLTQDDLIEGTGLDRRHLQRIERGTENITIETLVSLANALHVAPSVLLHPAKLEAPKPGRPKRVGRSSAAPTV